MEVFGGHHYAKTLRAWRANLMSAAPSILASGAYGIDVVRRYEYYFASCEAMFWMDGLNVTQLVFGPGYDWYSSTQRSCAVRD